MFAAGIGWYGTYTGSGLTVGPGGAVTPLAARVDGQISDAAPDGRGGVYIGGDFQHVGGVRRPHLAHLRRDGSLDERFRPRARGFVGAVRVRGGRVYAAGRGLVAYDARTGRLRRAYLPRQTFVTELAVTASTLYAGATSQPDPLPRPGRVRAARGLLAVPIRGGTPRRLVTGRVAALRVVAGRLWVGGHSSGSAGANTLRSVDLRTGRVAAVGTVRGRVDELLPLGGRQLLVAGAVAAAIPRTAAQDRALLSARRRYRAAIAEARAANIDVRAARARHRRTGARDPFRPTASQRTRLRRASARVRAANVAVITHRVPGLRSDGAVVIDRASGRIDRRFNCQLPGSPVDGLAVYDAALRGGRLWLAGERAAPYGAPDRTGLLQAVDPETCAATGPAAQPNLPVNALVPLDGGLLAGGSFWSATPKAAAVARFDALTGAPRGPVPSLGSDMQTEALLADHGVLWAASTREVRAIDPVTGRVRRQVRLAPPARNPRYPAAYGRFAQVKLAAAQDRIIVLRKNVTLTRPGTQSQLVSIDRVTGRVVELPQPYPSAGGSHISDIAVVNGSVYVAGSFVRTRGRQPANLAVVKIDPVTGRPDAAFDPHVNGPVQSLATDGRRLFLAGLFSQPRLGLLAIDPRTGAPDRTWTPASIQGRRAIDYNGMRLQRAGPALLLRGSRLARDLPALSTGSGAAVPARTAQLTALDLALPVSADRWFAVGSRRQPSSFIATAPLTFAGTIDAP
ncbi:hypothetical protein DSM112329_02918 [Paraconexibacter sp. AEG42_29]|uniref:Uncharacterized protein n=1 Tax=Paraconexibacter sp. AEG42_29 TaxID=2997339 RepID=A0AAU7AXK2_9ACTN